MIQAQGFNFKLGTIGDLHGEWNISNMTLRRQVSTNNDYCNPNMAGSGEQVRRPWGKKLRHVGATKLLHDCRGSERDGREPGWRPRSGEGELCRMQGDSKQFMGHGMKREICFGMKFFEAHTWFLGTFWRSIAYMVLDFSLNGKTSVLVLVPANSLAWAMDPWQGFCAKRKPLEGWPVRHLSPIPSSSLLVSLTQETGI